MVRQHLIQTHPYRINLRTISSRVSIQLSSQFEATFWNVTKKEKEKEECAHGCNSKTICLPTANKPQIRRNKTSCLGLCENVGIHLETGIFTGMCGKKRHLPLLSERRQHQIFTMSELIWKQCFCLPLTAFISFSKKVKTTSGDLKGFVFSNFAFSMNHFSLILENVHKHTLMETPLVIERTRVHYISKLQVLHMNFTTS